MLGNSQPLTPPPPPHTHTLLMTAPKQPSSSEHNTLLLCVYILRVYSLFYIMEHISIIIYGVFRTYRNEDKISGKSQKVKCLLKDS